MVLFSVVMKYIYRSCMGFFFLKIQCLLRSILKLKDKYNALDLLSTTKIRGKDFPIVFDFGNERNRLTIFISILYVT